MATVIEVYEYEGKNYTFSTLAKKLDIKHNFVKVRKDIAYYGCYQGHSVTFLGKARRLIKFKVSENGKVLFVGNSQEGQERFFVTTSTLANSAKKKTKMGGRYDVEYLGVHLYLNGTEIYAE